MCLDGNGQKQHESNTGKGTEGCGGDLSPVRYEWPKRHIINTMCQAREKQLTGGL